MKAYAKANIFLKLVGLDAKAYHLLYSRFILLEDFYDELDLIKDKKQEGFEIMSAFKCEDNIISKAYHLLCALGYENELKECFKTHSLSLIKNIPQGGGLGGGSSDAACFLKLMNESLNLKITPEKLRQIGLSLGSDVPFFLSAFKSANVFGVGELVEEIDDDIPKLRFIFPQFPCQTALVYKEFDKMPSAYERNLKMAKLLISKSSKELLQEYKNTALNDLFTSCVRLYPKMSVFMRENFFLSGSGSSVFEAV